METQRMTQEDETKMIRLLRRGWRLERGLWANEEHQHQGLPMLFTFEDACKAEGL